MKHNEDAAYYLSRAEQEDEAALRAANPLAASIHRTLASRYRVKASEPDEVQKLILVRD